MDHRNTKKGGVLANINKNHYLCTRKAARTSLQEATTLSQCTMRLWRNWQTRQT